MTVAVVNEEAYHGRNSGQTNQLLCGESLNTKKMSASCMKKKKKTYKLNNCCFGQLVNTVCIFLTLGYCRFYKCINVRRVCFDMNQYTFM